MSQRPERHGVASGVAQHTDLTTVRESRRAELRGRALGANDLVKWREADQAPPRTFAFLDSRYGHGVHMVRKVLCFHDQSREVLVMVDGRVSEWASRLQVAIHRG